MRALARCGGAGRAGLPPLSVANPPSAHAFLITRYQSIPPRDSIAAAGRCRRAAALPPQLPYDDSAYAGVRPAGPGGPCPMAASALAQRKCMGRARAGQGDRNNCKSTAPPGPFVNGLSHNSVRTLRFFIFSYTCSCRWPWPLAGQAWNADGGRGSHTVGRGARRSPQPSHGVGAGVSPGRSPGCRGRRTSCWA